MKKITIMLLVLCLAMGLAFADGLEVGVRGGYDMEICTQSLAGGKLRSIASGIAVMGTFDYAIKDSWGAKAAVGVTLANKVVLQSRGNSDKSWTSDSPIATPIQVKAFVGPTYCFVVNEQLDIDTAVGLDLAFGKQSAAADAKNALRLGLGIEAQVNYEVVKSLNIFLGAETAMYMFNSNMSGSVLSEPELMLCTRAFAGASYSF